MEKGTKLNIQTHEKGQTNVRGSPQPWGYVHQKGVTSCDIRFIKSYNQQ